MTKIFIDMSFELIFKFQQSIYSCSLNSDNSENLIFFKTDFTIKSLIGFKKSINPNKSVAKPGVIRKIPDITINKPSLNAFIKFCGSVILDNFK